MLDIVVGFVYLDNKHNVRKVLDIGPQYARNPDQSNKHCLRYKVLKQGSGPYRPGDEVDCTVESFQKWATKCLPQNHVKKPCQKNIANRSQSKK